MTEFGPLPVVAVGEKISALEQQHENAQTTTPDSFAILGARSDLAGGRGVRYRHGILPDGFYGVETFTYDGKRQRNGKWAGEVFFFAGPNPPEGCEEADGATVDPTTADQKYLYLARGMGVSEAAPFSKPNARGRVPVAKATSGTFQTLRATGGAETSSVFLATANLPSHAHGPGSLTISPNPHDHGEVYDVSGAVAAAGSDLATPLGFKNTGTTSLSLSGNNEFIGSGAPIDTSTLQPYIVLLACVAL